MKPTESLGQPSLRRVGSIRVEGVLGEGGMGTVYVGFDETLQRRVALKSIRDGRRFSPALRARFLREARVLSRLEHPCICRIHGFVEEADEDWLVLEYVEGATLARHIEHGRLEAHHRLHIATQIAEALVAAHALGVVHRDLKPDNVMVTPAGDAKVLDFGLARVAASEGGPEGDESQASESVVGESEAGESGLADSQPDDLVTEVGDLLGTPLYMSPEQARGGRVGTASDMYSFGLLLQTLWSGVPPYPRGLSRKDVLARAREGAVERQAGLPAGIAQLIGRLLSAAPATRATAVEALERLRWIESRPARLTRRVLAALLLLSAVAAGVKYTLDLRHERGIADRRRDQAEGLVSFMLGDLRTKLTAVGRLEILDEVGDEVRNYFAAVPESELSLAELSVRAKSLYQIGEVRVEQGRLPEAMEAFRESLAVGERLVAREPENAEALARLGFAHFWLASGHHEGGELEAALEHFQASADVARRLITLDPANLEWRLELAAEESNVARILLARGDAQAALAVLQDRLATVREIIAGDPERLDWRVELAASHLLLGDAHEMLGDLARALHEYRTDLEIMQQVVAADPAHAGHLNRLATSHSYLGALLEKLGESESAGQHFESQRQITALLSDADADNTSFRDSLATSLFSMGVVHRDAGRLAEARDPLEHAQQLWTKLAAGDPGRARWRLLQASACTELGRLDEDQGRSGEALALARQALALLAPLREPGGDWEAWVTSAQASVLEGRLLAAAGQAEAARASWLAALELLEAAGVPSSESRVLASRASALLLLGRRAEAEASLEALRQRHAPNDSLEEAPQGSDPP